MTRRRVRRAWVVRGVALGLAVGALSGCSRFVILNDALTAPEHNDLGVAYERGGQDLLAAAEYRRALRRDPDYALARLNLGNLAARSERWGEAERHYRRALMNAPSDPDGRNNLAIALLRLSRRDDETEWMARSALALGIAEDSIYRATLAEVLAARRSAP